MEIAFGGELTQEHMRQAYALHFKPTRRSFVLAGPPGVVFLLAVAGFILFPAFGGRLLTEHPWVALLFPLVAAGIAASQPLWLPRYLAGRWHKGPAARHRPLSGTAGEEGIWQAGPLGESRHSWQAYSGHRISPDMVLLYTLPALMQVFPRAFFRSDADWQAFVEAVRKRVPVVSQAWPRVASGARAKRLFIILLVVVAIVALLLDFAARRSG